MTSGFRLSDDFFSPVHQDGSVGSFENYDGSLSDLPNFDLQSSFTGFSQNKIVLKDFEKKQFELKSDDQNIRLLNTSSTPISSRKTNALLKVKRLEDTNVLSKDENLRKEDPTKNIKYKKEKPKIKTNKNSASLPSDEFIDQNTKVVKLKEKNTVKNFVNDGKKYSSDPKHFSGNRNLEDSEKNNDIIKFKNISEKSTISKKICIPLESENKNLNVFLQDEGKQEIDVGSSYSHYEPSIEKIVHDHINLECDKIRQNMYMQQMVFHREINKLKAQMEREHLATNERLCKVIEELVQINAVLKSIPLHVTK